VVDESIDDTAEVSEVGGPAAGVPYGGERGNALVLIGNTKPNVA
jgi:hypothetical protein